MEKMKNKGQQEIVGFVLIVVLVVVALMIFLIISVRDTGEEVTSVRVSNMLDVVMRMTTECAVVYEPDYDTFEDLFKSCYKGSTCKNLQLDACEYLEEEFEDVFSSMVLSDSSVNAWRVDFFVKDGQGLIQWGEGNCTGSSSGAQRNIISGGAGLIVKVKIS